MRAQSALLVMLLALGSGYLFHQMSVPITPTKIDVVTLENESREPLGEAALSIPETDPAEEAAQESEALKRILPPTLCQTGMDCDSLTATRAVPMPKIQAAQIKKPIDLPKTSE